MKPRPEEGGTLAERMRAAGLRLTGQRRLLAELLDHARTHLDAETVFRLARRRDPGIHRATVYRTLNSLKRLGLVDELDLMHVTGERHFYEVRPSTFHIHLICTSCGAVEEPGGPFWEDLKRRVERETGFAPDVVRLEMGGLCSRCGDRAARRRSGHPPPRMENPCRRR
jgi:Fur family ferric uptake transcriptional regulator